MTVLLPSASVCGLSTDRDQPINIEADTAELDDEKAMTVYRGNVIVIQGSIRMTGDEMTIYYTPENELDVVIMDGKPATYRQLPDDSQVYDEAEALHMEYHGKDNLIILTDKAIVKQEGLQFSGKRIEYDTVRSRIKARGDTGTDQTDTVNGADDGRVRITIQPRKK